MKVSVEIAFSFKRELADDYRSLDLPHGATVRDALEELTLRFPQIRERLFDEQGAIRRHINALVNGGNIQFRKRFDTVLQEGDRLSILPPVGGG
jgi:molybdopterin synthase sulfur carrier subunit